MYLLDDDRGILDAMHRLIRFAGMVTESYECAQDFLDSYSVDSPGCLVADVRLPDMSGLAVQEQILDRGPALPIIMITGFADVSTAVMAMSMGAFDFIEKPFDDETFLQSVRHAIDFDSENRKIWIRLQQLTSRERQVLESMVAGFQNKEIAEQLQISPRTVEKYRAFVMSKMQARNLSEVINMVHAAKAMRHQTGELARRSASNREI